MYENTLSKAGLSPDQARIYDVLLKNGPLPAGEVSKKAELKRGLTYKVLDELVALGLAKKNEKGKVLRFEPTHPLQLKELAERKEQEAKVAQEALGGIIGNLVADFNLISGKPGVRYYEGKEAVRILGEDSLSSKTDILTYIDSELMDKYLSKENAEYIKKRVGLGLRKRIISPDNAYNRNLEEKFRTRLVAVRLVNDFISPFTTVTQIYDEKISYLTLHQGTLVGIIIENPYISEMHRVIFEKMWQQAAPFVEFAPKQQGGDSLASA
ncbi:MAG: HTH-type transcriptional regulator, sugar sensing transcriptional regulator [Candidatus Dependentiae bacterium]|nr:HTH-type transcriptional regulator, sugar sensing transcriptional regulator [Candidatus Dependentiae bacterium]